MNKNVPNILTMVRVVLTPIFLLCFTMESIPWNYFIALIIFGVASITDALDGHIARKYELVSNFGKFMDPLADKMLTTAAFLGLMFTGYCNVWWVFLILFREFGISSMRLIAAAEGVVIPANMWGKVKTTLMMTLTPLTMFLLFLQKNVGVLPDTFPMVIFSNVCMGICTVATLVSGIVYLVQGAKIIDFSK